MQLRLSLWRFSRIQWIVICRTLSCEFLRSRWELVSFVHVDRRKCAPESKDACREASVFAWIIEALWIELVYSLIIFWIRRVASMLMVFVWVAVVVHSDWTLVSWALLTPANPPFSTKPRRTVDNSRLSSYIAAMRAESNEVLMLPSFEAYLNFVVAIRVRVSTSSEIYSSISSSVFPLCQWLLRKGPP